MPTLPSTYTTRRRDHIVVAPAFPDGEEALRESPTPDPDLDDLELIPVVTGDGVGAIISVSLQPRCIDRISPRLILSHRTHKYLPAVCLTRRQRGSTVPASESHGLISALTIVHCRHTLRLLLTAL